MTMSSSVGVWVLVCAISSHLSVAQDLVAVTVLYRHGHRSILDPYPTDPYRNESFWPVPFGELTNIGKNQHYALGKWLRQRYTSFLSRKYMAKEIHIRSSNYDRCLMSAASNLAGLYPPEGDQIWNQALNWQPIPIHSRPKAMDGMLALEKPCPEYQRLQKEQLNSNYHQKIIAANSKLYVYLSEKTGMKIKDFIGANDIYDTLLVENQSNYTLPEWTQSVFPEKLRQQAVIRFEFDTHTPQLAKFGVGQVFDRILTQFDSRVKNLTFPKFQMLSAHDTNVFNVLNSLGIPNLEMVPYTGMVIFELRRNSYGKYYVDFLYKKSDRAELLTIKGCETDCDYDRFKAILKPLSSIWREGMLKAYK
ncbi:prostatic acid phosphatase-like [Coccinella septempunctata]|uniref:prostatic acid phosphatase-like n=1 Tax=Coccinella septempunctata TaxID=41139 RepID=UPI001D0977FA|nr:prostatic acid phosphatase-like [Coccinella septempunctata]